MFYFQELFCEHMLYIVFLSVPGPSGSSTSSSECHVTADLDFYFTSVPNIA